VRALADALLIAALYLAAYRFPLASGRGYPEALAAFLLPVLVFAAAGRGRRLGWVFLGILAGIAASAGCAWFMSGSSEPCERSVSNPTKGMFL